MEAVLCGVPQELVSNDLSRSQLLSGQQRAALGAIGQGAMRWRLYYEGEHEHPELNPFRVAACSMTDSV